MSKNTIHSTRSLWGVFFTLLGSLLLSTEALANTQHTQVINMAGCRPFNTTVPLSTNDYLQYDTYNYLADWVKTNDQSEVILCDLRLPGNTISIDSVTMYYNKPNSTDLQPVLNTIITGRKLSGNLYEAYPQGTACTGSTTSTNSLYTYPCTTALNYTLSAYSAMAAYAFVSWASPGGTPTTNARVHRIMVTYTVP
jgi:hypothetical protein